MDFAINKKKRWWERSSDHHQYKTAKGSAETNQLWKLFIINYGHLL